MPMAFGLGMPTRLICPTLYLRVNALTVCQSSLNALATSSTGDCRQRRPMCQAKRLGVERVAGLEVEVLSL